MGRLESQTKTFSSTILYHQEYCGGSFFYMNNKCMSYDYGVSLPQYEHVDIFPVRLCLHSTEYSPSTLL